MKHADATVLLKEKKLKITPARVHILEMFLTHSSPLSAEEIYKKISKKHIDLATVYRNIGVFTEAHILKQIDTRQDSKSFELRSREHHHHITCERCGYTEDIHACNVKDISAHILHSSKKFSNITDHSLEFFSVCNICQKKS